MMLRYNYFQKEREDKIKKLHHQIKLYVLEKDEVAPSIEALNTLQGGYRNIKTEVEIQDFPYEYSHMVPFPLTNKIQKEELSRKYQLFFCKCCNKFSFRISPSENFLFWFSDVFRCNTSG